MSNNYECSLDHCIQNVMGNNGYCSDNDEPVSFEIDRTPEQSHMDDHSNTFATTCVSTCAGCIEDQPGQMAHMGQGGCMGQDGEEFEISYADDNDNMLSDYEYGEPPELVRENSGRCYCYQCRLDNMSDDDSVEPPPLIPIRTPTNSPFSDDRKEIRSCGINNNFYSYDGELYTSTFPGEWACEHLPGTGPKECDECREVGGWNGVFIAYCGPCARKYDFERGTGFDSVGHDLHSTASNSASNTYLYGIEWNDIGDTDIYDSYESSLKHVIRSGDGQDYFIHNRALYSANFSSQWAHEHIPGTGPSDCSNCYYYGSYNGIFQGYCGNCIREYDGATIGYSNDGKTGFYSESTDSLDDSDDNPIVRISYVNDAHGYNGDYRGNVNMEDGSRTGQGTMIFSDGSHYHGFWLDGLPHGPGRIVEKCIDSDEPCVYEGNFVNGKRTYGKIIFQGETSAYVNTVNGNDTFTPQLRRDYSMFL